MHTSFIVLISKGGCIGTKELQRLCHNTPPLLGTASYIQHYNNRSCIVQCTTLVRRCSFVVGSASASECHKCKGSNTTISCSRFDHSCPEGSLQGYAWLCTLHRSWFHMVLTLRCICSCFQPLESLCLLFITMKFQRL